MLTFSFLYKHYTPFKHTFNNKLIHRLINSDKKNFRKHMIICISPLLQREPPHFCVLLRTLLYLLRPIASWFGLALCFCGLVRALACQRVRAPGSRAKKNPVLTGLFRSTYSASPKRLSSSPTVMVDSFLACSRSQYASA
jgi:hypothetical protein